MQGKRSTIQSFPDTFEFDSGASSSNSGVDQPFYWNNMINPVETRNLPDYLLSPADANTSYGNAVGHASASLNSWALEGPSSSEHIPNQGVREETKMDHMWSLPLTINPSGVPRLEERRMDQAGILSLESVNISLHNNHVATDPLFLQNSTADDGSRNSNHDGGIVGNGVQIMETGSSPHPYNKPGGSSTEQMASGGSSADPGGTASGIIGSLAEDSNGRPGWSVDGRRIPCKRKNLEGVSGQSSLGGASPSYFPRDDDSSAWHAVPARHNAAGSLSISTPAEHLSDANSLEEPLNPRFGIGISGVSPECHPVLTGGGNAEGLQRSFRMRVNPAYQDSAPPNLWFAGNNSIRQPHALPPYPSPSSRLFPLNHPSLDLRHAATSSSSQTQPNLQHLPGFPRNVHPFTWNGVIDSRAGNSSSSSVISGERPASLLEEANARSMHRSISEHAMFVPLPEMRLLRHDSANWGSINGNINLPGSVASTSRIASSSEIRPSPAATWVPHQVPLTQFPRRLSEVVRRSLLSSSGSEAGGQSSLLPPLRSIPSTSSAEVVQPSGAGPQAHQQHYMRSALLDRQGDGILGVPLSLRTLAAASEGRNRLVSEIRNVLDLMRRGENLGFEDVLILNQSVFYGVADLHDRHRDMRLDVDNMSYEELLALEERIGNVSTGLSEETVIKCLKQRKFFSIANEAPTDVEPCCICQEEYVEEEEVGILDCGHDFHSSCIKQWLMHKNLCPICKTTGLVTS